MTMDVKTNNIVPIKGGAPVEVLSADETRANAVHLRVLELLKQYEETYFAMAQALYEVKAEKLYRSLDGGYATFDDYCQRGVGMDVRKAKYLTRIWWWYGVEQKANPKLLEGAQEIGWSKAKELIEVIDGRNASRWFRLASEMNLVDLTRAARAAKKNSGRSRLRQPMAKQPDEEKKGLAAMLPAKKRGAQETPVQSEGGASGNGNGAGVAGGGLGGVDPSDDVLKIVAEQRELAKEWKTFTYRVHKDHWKIIKTAFDYASKLADSTHQGHLLGLISLHYCSFYDKQKSVVLGEWLAAIERLTGVSLVALDRRTDEIVYGQELVEALASEDEADERESGAGNSRNGGGDIASPAVD
jgi:hypothetical protein